MQQGFSSQFDISQWARSVVGAGPNRSLTPPENDDDTYEYDEIPSQIPGVPLPASPQSSSDRFESSKRLEHGNRDCAEDQFGLEAQVCLHRGRIDP
jgi:hypothetical protein